MMPFDDSRINAEQRISLAISTEAAAVLEYDREAFGERDLATVINRVLAECRETGRAAIAASARRMAAGYLDMWRGITARMDAASRTEVEGRIRASAKEAAVEDAACFRDRSGVTKKIRINNDNFDYLTRACDEDEHYPSMGAFIRAVLEEYASLSHTDRERLYFAETLRQIEAAINGRDRNWRLRAESAGRRFTVIPYAVVKDPLSMYRYMLSVDAEEPDTSSPPRRISHRVSRLRGASAFQAEGIMPKRIRALMRDKRFWERELAEKGAQFISYEAVDARVRLTEAGERMYSAIQHLRPRYLSRADGTYSFRCTSRQLEMYFIRFGPEAEILEPSSLRERFRALYAKAIARYADGASW